MINCPREQSFKVDKILNRNLISKKIARDNTKKFNDTVDFEISARYFYLLFGLFYKDLFFETL